VFDLQHLFVGRPFQGRRDSPVVDGNPDTREWRRAGFIGERLLFPDERRSRAARRAYEDVVASSPTVSTNTAPVTSIAAMANNPSVKLCVASLIAPSR
jgi:hypothetical protein